MSSAKIHSVQIQKCKKSGMITYEKSKTNEKNQNSDPNPVVTTKMNARLGVKTD